MRAKSAFEFVFLCCYFIKIFFNKKKRCEIFILKLSGNQIFNSINFLRQLIKEILFYQEIGTGHHVHYSVSLYTKVTKVYHSAIYGQWLQNLQDLKSRKLIGSNATINMRPIVSIYLLDISLSIYQLAIYMLVIYQ